MSAVQMLRRQGASDEGTVHAAKWIGRGIQDEKVLRWFPWYVQKCWKNFSFHAASLHPALMGT